MVFQLDLQAVGNEFASYKVPYNSGLVKKPAKSSEWQ